MYLAQFPIWKDGLGILDIDTQLKKKSQSSLSKALSSFQSLV